MKSTNTHVLEITEQQIDGRPYTLVEARLSRLTLKLFISPDGTVEFCTPLDGHKTSEPRDLILLMRLIAEGLGQMIKEGPISVPTPVSTPIAPSIPDKKAEWIPAPKESLASFMELIKGRDDYFILDTETTGLDTGEIVQIAIINSKGDTVLNTLVKPVNGIPVQAQNIHGISNEKVSTALPWRIVRDDVEKVLKGKHVIIYNAVYDRKMLHKSDEAAGLERRDWRSLATWHCCMEAYAEMRGVWNDYHGSWRWHKLTEACMQQGIAVANAHDALGDCLMTLKLMERMKQVYQPK